jgi:hypothetical protein
MARALNERAAPTPQGKDAWTHTTVARIKDEEQHLSACSLLSCLVLVNVPKRVMRPLYR